MHYSMIDLDLVGFILRSRNRKVVIESLTAGPKNSRNIADETGIPRRSVTKAVKELKDASLVVGSRKEYNVTDEGLKVINCINERGRHLDG